MRKPLIPNGFKGFFDFWRVAFPFVPGYLGPLMLRQYGDSRDWRISWTRRLPLWVRIACKMPRCGAVPACRQEGLAEAALHGGLSIMTLNNDLQAWPMNFS